MTPQLFKLDLDVPGKGIGQVWTCAFEPLEYGASRRIAMGIVNLDDEGNFEPFSMLSVNLPSSADLPLGSFYVKHWNENERVVNKLLQMGLIELDLSVLSETSGFISNIQAYRLTPKGIAHCYTEAYYRDVLTRAGYEVPDRSEADPQ